MCSLIFKKTSPNFKMREIVHIQAGQCGNQIGAKVRYGFFDSRFGKISKLGHNKDMSGILTRKASPILNIFPSLDIFEN